MELPRLPDGRVNNLSLVRAIRGVSCQTLGTRIGVSAEQITRWERGLDPYPTGAKLKRISLALGWPLSSLNSQPSHYDVAWEFLLKARRMQASLRGNGGMSYIEPQDIKSL